MSQETKSIAAARQLIMKKVKWSKAKADEYVRKTIRSYFPILRNTNHGAKFILGVTRMFIYQDIANGETIRQLNSILKYIASDAHINEYDRNLNGESLQTLVKRFSENVTNELERDKEEISRLKLIPNEEYSVTMINSFEDALKYQDFTSWCIVHNEKAFNSYTGCGVYQFYFILRNGFENEPKVTGENTPLDNYGLSMIAVCVDENGGLKTCTCRWNHDNNGNDIILNTKQTSELIGRRFYEVFKPNNNWENALERAISRLKNGENPKEIFDIVEETNDVDISYITLKNKCNFIDKDGKLLRDKWLYSATKYFEHGYVRVRENALYNLMDKSGNLFSEQWFDLCAMPLPSQNDKYFEVRISGKWNLMSYKTHKCILNEWYDHLYHVLDGKLFIATQDDVNFLLNKNGEKIKGLTFDNFLPRVIGSFSFISKNKKYNMIDENGKILFEKWFDHILSFFNRLIMVRIGNKWNFVNFDGKLISEEWFDYISSPKQNGIVIVNIGEQWNIIDGVGNFLLKNWLPIQTTTAEYIKDGKKNQIEIENIKSIRYETI